VIPTVGDIAEQLTEPASELAHRNRLRHRIIVPDCVHAPRAWARERARLHDRTSHCPSHLAALRRDGQ
jgi:hypothetical protein